MAPPEVKREKAPALSEEDAALIKAAYAGLIEDARSALKRGARVDAAEPRDGLTALHIAAGSNDLPMARLLIEEGKASFKADRFGRWPSTVAAEAGAGEALCDYIVEQEAAFLERGRQPSDLTRIRGIGVLLGKRLNALGIWRYEQIAGWSAADIERLDAELGFEGRIAHEKWVEQARALVGGGKSKAARRAGKAG